MCGDPQHPQGSGESWGAQLGRGSARPVESRQPTAETLCRCHGLLCQGTGSHNRQPGAFTEFWVSPRSASEGAAGGLGKGPSPQPSHGCLRLALKENPQARRPCSRGHHTNSPGPSPAGHPASPAGRRAVSSRGPRGAAPRTCGPTAATQGSLSPSPSALSAPRTSHTLTSPPAAPFPEAGCPRPARLASPRERASVPGAVRGGRRPDPWAPTAAYLQGPG